MAPVACRTVTTRIQSGVGVSEERFDHDVVVIGGGGHVGLPLAIAFASRGLRTCVYDINAAVVEQIGRGVLPFVESGAGEVLTRVLDERLLDATTDGSVIGRGENVVVVIGTPVDEHLNPDPYAVPAALEPGHHHLVSGQLLVLRSTLYPGVTARVERMLRDKGVQVDVAFCPERIAEGKAMEELFTLPQIVSARTPEVRAPGCGAVRILDRVDRGVGARRG